MKNPNQLASLFLKSFMIVLVFSLLSFSAMAEYFYVSQKGSDSNPGTLEKPFATLEKAKEEVQNSIRKNGEDVHYIFLEGGRYEIEDPILFDSEVFSGNSKVFIKGITDENPVISGGKKILNWNKNDNNIWVAKIPKDLAISPNELFFGDKRATRARFPNEGYLRVKKVGKDRRTNFFFNKNDFPIPESTKGVEIVLLHDWSISRVGVKEINAKKNKLTATDSIGTKSPDFFNLNQWEKDPRYYLENAIEFLDADYEWFYNAQNHSIHLKLPENETPKNQEVIVPFAESLIQIKGTEEKSLNNIHFEGITFQHCAWEIPEQGYCGVQACYYDARPKTGWTEVPAAVKVEWAENCSFSKCEFKNLGTSGLWIATGSKHCTIDASLFEDISANGVMIGEGRDRFINDTVWWKVAPEQVALGNRIESSTITNCGVRFFGAIGIWCGFTAQTEIKNNEIYNLPYSGISIGWEWSPIPTPCRENIIDGNHIHHILKKLSDGGGIYMLGLQPGSKLVNNHIHDVKVNAGRAESNGMFLDEGTTDVLVANNLIYRIAKSPLRFHKATTNLIKENYLFCTDDNPHIRYNRTNEEDIKQVGNKVFLEGDENYTKELEAVIKKW